MADKAVVVVNDQEIAKPEEGKDPYAGLAAQCRAEYKLSWDHQKPEKDEAGLRLKLYNNQKRDKKAVGDTTMFTTHQTVLASLYDDRLQVSFMGREDGDEETAENLEAMAKFDYDEMEKDQLDYYWDWDTTFFGRGLLSCEEYIRDPENGIYVPVPHVLDPLTFLRDPRAVSVNGDRMARGAARWLGYDQKMTREQIKALSGLVMDKEDIDWKEFSYGSGTQSLLADSITARNDAQGFQDDSKLTNEENLGENGEYDISVWYTHFRIKGVVKKVKVWLANDRTKVVAVKVLKHNYWQIVDRPLYPHSHDWRGTSIPDLTEDKQRARAIASNLGLNMMKADLMPSYIYDSNKITNRKDLQPGFNKFIPVDPKGENLNTAIMPMIKARPNLGLLDFIYQSLDASAQKATATPEIQQGAVSSEKRTLGELNLVSSKVDTRYSLSAKIFGWSEKRFWNIGWYQSYKDNFEDGIDEKVVRIVGAFGAKWRPLMKKDFVTRIDPDIIIESKILSRAKQLEDRALLSNYFAQAVADPTANRRWAMKKLGRLNGLTKDEIDRLYPPTVDERIAEEQNDLLNQDRFVQVLPEDDHNVHLEVHAKANQTAATLAHIKTHQRALEVKKVKPELFPTDTGAANFQGNASGVTPTPSGAPTPTAIQPSQTSGASGAPSLPGGAQ